MQKKNDRKLKSLKSTLEEGELSSTNSEERTAHGSNEGPSSSYRYFITKILKMFESFQGCLSKECFKILIIVQEWTNKQL